MYRCLTSLSCLLLLINLGCSAMNEIDPQHEIRYVLRKGSAQDITEWTLRQTSPSKLSDGINALKYLLEAMFNRVQEGKESAKSEKEGNEALEGIVRVFQLLIRATEDTAPQLRVGRISAAEADQLLQYSFSVPRAGQAGQSLT